MSHVEHEKRSAALLMLIAALVFGLLGCQKTAEWADRTVGPEPEKENRSASLPVEPDDLPQNPRSIELGLPHLKAAVQAGDLEMFRYLLSQGVRADPNPAASEELMRIALVDHRSPELVELISEAGEEKKYCVQSKACTSFCHLRDFAHPLYHAVMANDLNFCRYLIREFSSDENLWAAIEYEPYEYENGIDWART